MRDAVGEIVDAVRHRGDDALLEYVRTFDAGGAALKPIRAEPAELEAAAAALAPEVRHAIERAIENLETVMVGWRAGLGQSVEVGVNRVVLRHAPVSRAAVYVPGGRAPYPSTVVMGVVTARAAGVREVVVCTPPPVDPALLAACALAGVGEVYRIGGAQAIAALAYGTATIPRVDVVAGPGNLYVQEAKRLLAGRVGIDSFAGPSDLFVLFDAADAGSVRLIALDLLAQAEHGEATAVIAAASDAALLDALQADLEALERAHRSASSASCALVEVPSLDSGLALVNEYAPEHLELIGPGAEALAPGVLRAGALFVGWPSATAFGDYVAGSNHVLPTAGAARFASGLTPAHFRRQMAEVRITPESLPELIRAGAPIAEAEGFRLHAESMRARVPDIDDNSR
ncbi:MAG TPA: histidinol dehydrogenase [Solirubrobacteraceae bacterium]|nr:histidinol dehydrogenase [Solirubrobacteraceae bacterium]